MIQTLRLRFLSLFFACLLSLTTGCDNASQMDSQGSSKSANPSEESQSPTVDSPEPLAEQLVGRRPPAIHVAKWVKGEPLTEFEPGKVYVVDFWATWCGPCIAAIPHLTKLAQEHEGKVEVIGISNSEQQRSPTDTAYIDRVAEFVAKKGDRMDYRVAVDTPDKKMYSTWFKPTGTGGIQLKFMLLMQRNKPIEVNAYMKELLEKYPTNGDVLGFASACAVSTNEEARFDKQLSFEVAKKSVELNDPDSRFGQFAKWRLGWAYYHIGNREKAIESMRLAQDGINRLKAMVDFGDLDVQCEDALKVFETPDNLQ